MTTEEFPADTLVYLRSPGRGMFELIIATPDGTRQIIVPVSDEQVARLNEASAPACAAIINRLHRKIADA